MNKKAAIERIIKKSDLPDNEKNAISKALSSLTETKETVLALTVADSRKEIIDEIASSIDDAIAATAILSVPEEKSVAREISALTERNPEGNFS